MNAREHRPHHPRRGNDEDIESEKDRDEAEWELGHPPGKRSLALSSIESKKGRSKRRHRKPGGRTALPEALQHRFEAALGTDISHVRLHNDSAAAARAANHSARAYAQGSDIHFGAGEYDPSSPDGQHLIAHEIAHVVQQSGGTGAPRYKLAASQQHDPVEREADRAADAMVRGESFSISSQPTQVSRQAPEKETVPGVLKTASAKLNQAGTVTQTEAMISGSNVIAQAPGVQMMATVALKPDVDPDPDEILAGWVQTVVSSRRVAVYQKAGETVRKKITAFESVRDAKEGAEAPFYESPEKLTRDNRAVFPMASDQPKVQFPARDGGGDVTSLEGSDNFVASLKVGTTGNLHTIESFSWSAPWSIKVNPSGVTHGKAATIGPAYSHPDPTNEGTANEVGKSSDSQIDTYESVAQASAALARGFQPFVRELGKHHRLDKGSYWNMITALWKSGVRISVELVPTKGGSTEVPLVIAAEKRVDQGTVSTEGSYSALGHMVYDPTALGPGHSIFIAVDGVSHEVPFPYEGKVFRDVEATDDPGTLFNIAVSIG